MNNKEKLSAIKAEIGRLIEKHSGITTYKIGFNTACEQILEFIKQNIENNETTPCDEDVKEELFEKITTSARDAYNAWMGGTMNDVREAMEELSLTLEISEYIANTFNKMSEEDVAKFKLFKEQMKVIDDEHSENCDTTERKNKSLYEIIIRLWDLLDKIDTYAELKIDDTDLNNPFRKIMDITQERHKFVKSDGYDLFIENENITNVDKDVCATALPEKQDEYKCDTCTNDKGCVTCENGELYERKPVSTKEEAIAVKAANIWCRCFKCDGLGTPYKCNKNELLTCAKWYDSYKAAMIALELNSKKHNIADTNDKDTTDLEKSNEEKAREIAQEHEKYTEDCRVNLHLEGKSKVDVARETAYAAAIEMAEWKDRQFKEQSDQAYAKAVEKACEWLRRTQPQTTFPNTTLERFKQAMEEDQ